jgi:hypothetical protein
MTDKTEVPGLQQWKDRLWEVNREIKSLLMLSNVTNTYGLLAYIDFHDQKEFEAITSPEDYARFEEAISTLKDLLPSPSQREVIIARKDALTLEREALNKVKDMFL